MECNRAHWADWRMRQLQKANGRSSNGQQPEPEVEGDTRCRVAIGSKMWFGVEVQLNGQRHNPGWIQFKTHKSRIERWRENTRMIDPLLRTDWKDVRQTHMRF